MLKSDSTLSVWLVSLGTTLVSPVANAQAWPSKPIRLIIPLPEGGAIEAGHIEVEWPRSRVDPAVHDFNFFL